MGVETWNDGYVNIWEGTTDRKVHLTGSGSHSVYTTNYAITYLSIWDGAGNDDIVVGALNTTIYANSGNDRYFIASGINARIDSGAGLKNIATNYLAGSLNIYESKWWSQRHINVSAWHSYVQSGNANDTISAYGLSAAIVEDAGGNNTVTLSGGGYLKADLGWGSIKNGSDTVHLHTGWKADLIKSGGSLYVYNHNYRGGDSSVWTRGGHWNSSLDNLGYYDGSAYSHKIDLRVNRYADIQAYGAGWNVINLWGSDGSSRMRISSPGTNEILATRGDDVINVAQGGRWTEVNLDHGNDELRIHSGVSAKVTMGRGNKTVVSNYLGGNLTIEDWGMSGARNINVRAGNVDVHSAVGNDTITVFGLWRAKVRDAGGNNTLDVRGSGVEVDTGDGNDTIYVSGVAAKVASGHGNDSITLDGLDVRLNDAGVSGAKRVLARAGGAYLYTGSGNDIVEFHGLGSHVQTNAGQDTVIVRGVGAYVDTGSGDDTVDLQAAGATVTTGDGNDTVRSLGVGGQKVDLGNGNDTLEAYGGANIVLAGLAGTKSITVGGGFNVVQMGHGANASINTVNAYGGMNVVLSGHGNNAVNAYGGGNFLMNGNGRYLAHAYGGLNVVLSGQGQAEINAYGSTNIVMAGDRGNTLRAYGIGYLTGIGNLLVSGRGDDRIKVGGLLSAVTPQLGVTDDEFGFDRIVVGGADASDTVSKTAQNVLGLVASAAFNAGNIVIAGDGNNKVKAYGGYNFVQTGSGHDAVSMVGGFNAAVVGNGRNRIFAIGGNNIVVAGAGDDEMQALGGANVFFANAGNNRMTAIGGGNLFVAADGNDDMLAIGGGNVAIMGGGHNTALLAGGYGNLVQSGAGDDRVLALSQWNVMILGDGNNTVGALGGGGNLVWTGSGNDTVISLGLYVGNILLLGDGSNFAISGGRANIVMAGSGRDSVLSVGQYNFVSTASGIDNVVVVGQYNLVHTGGDDDIAAVIGKLNFVDTGWGNDVALVVGKTNIVLTEAGDDTALVIGQNNYVFAGSGNDMVAVFGETNYVLAGSGHDLVAVFGKKNIVATDNEIVFNDDDLGALKESKKVKSFNSKGKDWSGKTGLDISTQAELKLSADLALYFPDIEFSNAQTSDWKHPTLTLPSYHFQIPSMPALRSAPAYAYGVLGDYGLPSLSFPMLSSPQLQLPGITIPSFSIPNFADVGVQIDQFKPNFFADFNVGSDWFGGFSSAFQSLTGLPNSSAGASNTMLGGRLSLQPKLSGDLNFNQADLTGKVSGSSQATVNAVVASGTANAQGNASANTKSESNVSGGVFGAGNLFSAQGSAHSAAHMASATGTTSHAGSVQYALPTLSFGDIKLPNLQINGFDFSGYTRLFTTLFSGRDLYGVTLPDFKLLDFKVDNINLADYTGGTQSLTIKGMNYALPSLQLPRIAGIDYQSRLPNLNTAYRFNQGDGDVAVVGGEDNRVMTGDGDDLALVMGKTNALFMGDGNDAGLMVGEKNAWRGGKGNDVILALGKENAVKGNEGNDILFVLGQTNKVEGGSGDDVVVALGKSNEVDGGEGKDLMLIVGQKNNINGKADDSTGDGDDTILVLGQENNVRGGRGNDWLIACGMSNQMDGGQGNDVIVAAGWKNTLYGDFAGSDNGNDVIISVGGANKVQGNGGNDLIIAAGLGNQIEGNAGNDILLAAGLGQSIDTGDGDDIAVALGAGNQISAGAGQDTLYVAGVLGNVFGGADDDVLFALGAGNLLWGQEGNDIFLAQGISSRQLVAAGKLPSAVAAIDSALDLVNTISQGISAEAVPARLNAYARQDNTNTYAYGGSGNDVFFSGFQNLIADGGEGLDTYHYYLGDGRMTVRDHSVEADKLIIHAEQLAAYGSKDAITTNSLYFDVGSNTLSVIQAGKKYGDIVVDGIGTGSDHIEFRHASGVTAIDLRSLSAYSGAAPTLWAPTVPSDSASILATNDVASLYDTLARGLRINSTSVLQA
ncbi:calcium-binding protein [uncultured Herbaspirillum sp.]|uniref:beta strand repeat-containing protein n=1 Tax=uncultured Herbaspirillum sp. TaxID=160236 RepID=UPI00258811B6|nr:calcium-binding protein [uncultured Herbaspirillum sp.]